MADVVAAWTARRGKPFTLRLDDLPVEVESAGADATVIEVDALEFCRTVAGRARGEGLLAMCVVF